MFAQCMQPVAAGGARPCLAAHEGLGALGRAARHMGCQMPFCGHHKPLHAGGAMLD